MKKMGYLLLALILVFTLCACTQGDSSSPFAALPPADQAEKYFSEADCIFYENGSVELYGRTLTNLVPAVDSLYPHLTNALEVLHLFELSAYTETDGTVEPTEGSPAFYVGIEDSRCKVTLGIETPTSDMTIHFLFDDGSTYQVKGPYSADLLRVADLKTSALTNTDVVNGNLRVTDLSQDSDETYIIQRGVAILIQDIMKLTIEETTPVQDSNVSFDLELEVIGGTTYLCNSQLLYVQDTSDPAQQTYAIVCSDQLAQLLRMFLEKAVL